MSVFFNHRGGVLIAQGASKLPLALLRADQFGINREINLCIPRVLICGPAAATGPCCDPVEDWRKEQTDFVRHEGCCEVDALIVPLIAVCSVQLLFEADRVSHRVPPLCERCSAV